MKHKKKWKFDYATRDRVTRQEGDSTALEGWALVIGKFDGEQELLAVSSPAENNNKGLVCDQIFLSFFSYFISIQIAGI